MTTDAELERAVQPLWIIIPAMLTGMLGLAAVVLMLGGQLELQPKLEPILLTVLGIFGMSEAGAWQMVRAAMLRNARAAWEAAEPEQRPVVLGPHLLRMGLIPAAMAEAFGLFGCVVVLITGNPTAWVAPGLAIVALLMLLPTNDRIAARVSRIESM